VNDFLQINFYRWYFCCKILSFNLVTLARKLTYLAIAFFLTSLKIVAQPNLQNFGRGMRNLKSGGADSLRHRSRSEDSITVWYRYLDSSRHHKLDSSVNDFTLRFPIPATNIYLGNLGNASRSILFSPYLKPGWDPGFHALDIYKWKPEAIRFFNTTRPYSEVNYFLGSHTEQIIEVFNTQNIKPNWNASFQYRLINSPGFYQNQNTNNTNILFTSWYESKKKRYNNYFFLLANHLQSSENGGLANDSDLANTKVYKDRFTIPTVLGQNEQYNTNFFSTVLKTGNRYREFTALMRQQYDLGKKDSLVTDSTVIPLFYPRVRFEHTISYTTYKYQYIDNATSSTDTSFYLNYDLTVHPGDSVYFRDRWKSLVNDLSVYQFPDAKNLQQFVKLGATFQNIRGEFSNDSTSFYNIVLHAEYRNRTRNQKWDAELFGNLYTAGFNSGDYNGHISLKRFVGKKKQGYAEIGFDNVNRSPSFLYDSRSSFPIDHSLSSSFKKENISHIFASIYEPALKLNLSGDYYLVSNYLYFADYNKPQQYDPLFNFLQVSAEKTFRLAKHFNWYADVYVQQKTGSVPLQVPLVFTRNRFAYEGTFFKNLNLFTGLEVKYHTPYKADDYSPVLGQFFYQDSVTISNLPDISAFVQFRIKGFKAFLRLENLNTMEFSSAGFGFTNNNLAAPGYPYPGLQFRIGIWWSFVN
jgi:hypothetical protein